MEFEKAYNNLNEQQRQAVDHIDGPLLVIAGPGTGKTQLLSVRVANILKQTDATPENILCLTFTEAAASNMRHRLADFIGPEAYKVQIHTYHSFGSYILQEHRPDLKNSIDDIGRFQLIRDIQSKLKITSPLRDEKRTKDIIKAIGNLKSAAISADDIDKIIYRNREDNAAILSAIDLDLQQISKKYPANIPHYQGILEALKDFINDASEYITDRVEPLAHIYYRSLADILLKYDGETSIATELRAWRDKYFKKDASNRYVFGDAIANEKLADLAIIMRQYSEVLSEGGLYDYEDMILMAIDLLKNDAEKRFNAQERFQYILLDEYQDTNDAQSQLVAQLTDNPNNEGRPNIMAVGDDDQAIYGFQGASSSNFFEFDAKYHPKHILLSKNYRSSAEILGLAHNVIEQGTDRFCTAPNVAIDKNITAENPPEKTHIEYREFKSYQAEYSHVARQIKALLDKGIRGSKISIIAPKHKHLISILPYLHALDIRVSYERRENILDNPKIATLVEFCKFLQAISEQNLDRANQYCFHLFSLPEWGISSQEIISLISDARTNRSTIIAEMQKEERSDNVKNAINWCVELASKISSYSAEYIITQIVAKVFSDTSDYDFYSNLNTLRDGIFAKQATRVQLHDFVTKLEAYEKAELQIQDHSPYHESDDAVVIQTIHSSKGLEYEYVFLIAVDNYNWSDAKGNTDKITLPRNLEYVRHTGDSADEKLRLFFVAITRAKAELLMSFSTSDFAGKNVDRLKFLNTYEKDNKVFSRTIPEQFNEVIPSTSAELEPRDISPSLWFDNYVPDDEVRKNLYKPKVEHLRLFPTQLNAFLDVEYAGPIAFLKSYIIGVPTESNFFMNYGNFVHEIMDKINKENISNKDAYEHFLKLIDDADMTEDEKRDLRDRGDAEILKFLEARGDQLRDTKADSEHSFFSENIMLDDIPLGGKIDRIEIDEESKTITVADFKTAKPKYKWDDKNNSVLKYKLQLYFYKFLIEDSRDYKNYKVTKGRIDFIAPGEKGDISSLELDFDDEEAIKIKQLIKIVYAKIKALDFQDVSEYSKIIDFIDSLFAQ
ncbi:MAG: ATP-dependent helicase [Candidatus Saccharibacteria bacterium]|nr:ATP-dependent helicase [Candidatus Saccharibacteria bacterium]